MPSHSIVIDTKTLQQSGIYNAAWISLFSKRERMSLEATKAWF